MHHNHVELRIIIASFQDSRTANISIRNRKNLNFCSLFSLDSLTCSSPSLFLDTCFCLSSAPQLCWKMSPDVCQIFAKCKALPYRPHWKLHFLSNKWKQAQQFSLGVPPIAVQFSAITTFCLSALPPDLCVSPLSQMCECSSVSTHTTSVSGIGKL